MSLSSAVIAGGALIANKFRVSVKAYRKNKDKKKPKTPLVQFLGGNQSRTEELVRKSPRVRNQDFAQYPVSAPTRPTFLRVRKEDEISAEEQEINRYLTYAGVSLMLATTSMWYPVLTVAYVPTFLYTLRPFLVRAYHGVVKEKKVGVAVIDALGTAGPFLLGHFFVASLAICLANLSHKLIIKTEDRSRGSLINIFGEQPRFVWIEKEGVEVEIPVEILAPGDVVVVHAGQTIAVDGIITRGVASIDERALTGESQPVEKQAGDQVFASTLLLSGQLYIQVEKAGHETVAAQIGDILNSTADFKSSILSRGQKIVDLGATPTVALSALALPFLGIESALALLYASFGYHMRFAAPISVLNFLRITAENGILIKDGRALEQLSQIDTVIFDKTGTLTEEVPTVGAIHPANGYSKNELAAYAAAAEDKQSHPIALAITNFAQSQELTLPPISGATVEVGYGLTVKVQEKLVRVGSGRFMDLEGITIPADIKTIEGTCHTEGYSLVYVAIDNQLAGAIELHPTIRPEAKQITSELRRRNIKLYIISGDHQKPTQKLAQSLGIDHYFAQVLPQDKASLIEQLQNEGRSVCFIGDGINDSIALKKANVSISMRGASTIATDTAGIILMDGTLNQFIRLLEIANDLDTNLTRSSYMTVVPGIICVGGVLFLHFGIVSSLILFNIGLAASVSNALMPLLKHQREKLPGRQKANSRRTEIEPAASKRRLATALYDQVPPLQLVVKPEAKLEHHLDCNGCADAEVKQQKPQTQKL